MRACPSCGVDSTVIDTRRRLDGVVVRRFRCTGDPRHRFTTFELFDPDLALMMKKAARYDRMMKAALPVAQELEAA